MTVGTFVAGWWSIRDLFLIYIIGNCFRTGQRPVRPILGLTCVICIYGFLQLGLCLVHSSASCRHRCGQSPRSGCHCKRLLLHPKYILGFNIKYVFHTESPQLV